MMGKERTRTSRRLAAALVTPLLIVGGAAMAAGSSTGCSANDTRGTTAAKIYTWTASPGTEKVASIRHWRLTLADRQSFTLEAQRGSEVVARVRVKRVRDGAAWVSTLTQELPDPGELVLRDGRVVRSTLPTTVPVSRAISLALADIALDQRLARPTLTQAGVDLAPPPVLTKGEGTDVPDISGDAGHVAADAADLSGDASNLSDGGVSNVSDGAADTTACMVTDVVSTSVDSLVKNGDTGSGPSAESASGCGGAKGQACQNAAQKCGAALSEIIAALVSGGDVPAGTLGDCLSSAIQCAFLPED